MTSYSLLRRQHPTPPPPGNLVGPSSGVGDLVADVAFSFGLLFFTLALAGPVRTSSTASVVLPSPTYLERAKNAKASMQDGGGVLAPSASSCDHVLIFNFLKRNIAIKK